MDLEFKQYARISKKTKQEASMLIDRARRSGVGSFADDVFGLGNRREIESLVRMAVSHCRLQERSCNGPLSKSQERMERFLESHISLTASKYGLTCRFDGDPRGYTVKLFHPSRDVMKSFHNTFGGIDSAAMG